MVSHYSLEKSVRLGQGDEVVLGDYRFVLTKFGHVEGPNYVPMPLGSMSLKVKTYCFASPRKTSLFGA